MTNLKCGRKKKEMKIFRIIPKAHLYHQTMIKYLNFQKEWHKRLKGNYAHKVGIRIKSPWTKSPSQFLHRVDETSLMFFCKVNIIPLVTFYNVDIIPLVILTRWTKSPSWILQGGQNPFCQMDKIPLGQKPLLLINSQDLLIGALQQ